MPMLRSLRAVAVLALLGLPLAALAGCSSSSSDSGGSCAIPDGQYTTTTTASGGADCMGGTSMLSWPATAPGADGGAVPETCSAPTTQGGSCYVSCAIPGGDETFTITYALTSTGFSGTATNGPVEGEDGGSYTCTYTVTATKN
jgi:hypothetical protein